MTPAQHKVLLRIMSMFNGVFGIECAVEPGQSKHVFARVTFRPRTRSALSWLDHRTVQFSIGPRGKLVVFGNTAFQDYEVSAHAKRYPESYLGYFADNARRISAICATGPNSLDAPAGEVSA